jgi:hypothetical protein
VKERVNSLLGEGSGTLLESLNFLRLGLLELSLDSL